MPWKTPKSGNTNNNNSKPKAGKRKATNDKAANQKSKRKLNKCSHCGKLGHPDDACWELEKNKDRRPSGWESVKKGVSQTSPIVTLNATHDVTAEMQKD